MNSMIFILSSTTLTPDFDTGLDWEDWSIIEHAIMDDEGNNIKIYQKLNSSSYSSASEQTKYLNCCKFIKMADSLLETKV